MRIRLVSPARRGSGGGNEVTARRWTGLLRSLGHEVRVEREYRGGRADLLVALHARKSHTSVLRFRERQPDGRIVVALTGTDLYVDLHRSRAARESVQVADRLVVLQPLALEELWPDARRKARVILQSAPGLCATVPAGPRRARTFDLLVLGHLRPVKDPFRAALAARLLPPDSRIRILQVGRALSEAMARRARAEMTRNARYLWLGPRPRAQALRLLAGARGVVLTSRSEGGANVISEAVRSGVPVLASRIPGSVGLLGADYPGYFPVGDSRGLAKLLLAVERDPVKLNQLARHCRGLEPRFRPERERAAWRKLLRELAGPHR